MLTRLRTQFGTAGLLVAIVALVAAIGGTALAASGALTGKQKKEVTKIAKKYAGKPGAAGAQGPAGPAGAKGDTGSAGSNGTNGKDGTNGTNGVSPTGAAFAGNANGCTEGGVKFTGANTTVACNGVKGADGETGFTKTLPSGETETGMWALGNDDGPSFVPLTLNIPLAEPPTEIRYVNQDGEEKIFNAGFEYVAPSVCLGSAGDPSAPAGILCVYAGQETDASIGENETFAIGEGFYPLTFLQSFYSAGATFFFSLQPGDRALGTWAVTAP